MTPEDERRQQIERDHLALVDPKKTGQLPRIADTIYEAGKEFEKDQAQFQRDHGPAFLRAFDKIPAGAQYPANDGRLPDQELNRLDDYGHGRGFLKVNPEGSGNLYEDMANVDKDGARPVERLAVPVSDRPAVRAEVVKLQDRAREERDRERERCLEDDSRW